MESSERRLGFRPDHRAGVVHFPRRVHNGRRNQRYVPVHLAQNRSQAENTRRQTTVPSLQLQQQSPHGLHVVPYRTVFRPAQRRRQVDYNGNRSRHQTQQAELRHRGQSPPGLQAGFLVY